jgi:large subunit ribosomal protein L1
MDKKKILEALKQLREKSEKRNFTQKIDLILNLKNIDLKKPEENIDLFVDLPHLPGKKIKICALIGKELEEQAKIFDKTIKKDEFAKYQDNKKELKKLARDFDYFIAQSNLMTEVAKVFGKTLGPRNKMPNPKAGSVILPTSNLSELKSKLEKTIRVKTRNEPILKTYIGNESMKDDELADNIVVVHDSILKILPLGEANIKNFILKLTMGPVIKIEK